MINSVARPVVRRGGRAVSLALALCLSAAVLPARAENLLDIVSMAQDSDPDFQAAKFQNRADAEATSQAWARFLPQVRGNVNYQFQRQDIISSDNAVYAVGSTNYPDYGYALTLDQSLFNYSNWANLKAARALKRQSDAQFEAAKQDLLIRAAERYFTALAAMETAEAARAEGRALKQHFEFMQGRQQGGTARTAELSDAQARYLQSQAKQEQADAAVRDALAAIKQMTGNLPGGLNGLSEKLQIQPLNPAEAQYWTDMARQSNPRIKAAREAAERGHQEVEVQRSGWYPDVALQAFQNRHKTEGSLFGGGSDIDSTGVMLKLNVPIYEGGATSSRIREAEALYGKSLAQQDRAARDVERETESAVDGIKTASRQVNALAASELAQRQVAEQLNEAFKSGASSSLDVLDSQRDLFLARAQFVRARYDYALNTLKLRHAVGLLDISDVDQINRLLTPGQVAFRDMTAGMAKTSPPKPQAAFDLSGEPFVPNRDPAVPAVPAGYTPKDEPAVKAEVAPAAVPAVSPQSDAAKPAVAR